MAHRSLAWLAAAALAVSLVGLVVDKVFADNTPPYDEPLVALIGFAGFMLGMLAFLGFGAAALVRELRARRADESPNQHLRLDAGAAAVILATTQIALWWDLAGGPMDAGLLALSAASALALVTLAVRRYCSEGSSLLRRRLPPA